MENRSHALLAGLFIITLACSALAALWWFGGKHQQTDEYLVTTTRNVTGLNKQAQVRYRGIRVGRVESIDLDPSNPRNTLIRISVNEDIPVTRGTTAKLGYQGVTGIAHILLEQSNDDLDPLLVEAGQMARIPMQSSFIQELTDSSGETLRNARDFLVNANEVLSPKNRENVSKILANLEATTSNTREVSTQMRQLLSPENVQALSTAITHVSATAAQAAPFFSEARGLVSRLQKVSDKLDVTLGDSSSGVASLVPKLGELSTELSANSQQLNRILKMLEDSPQSFIFGKPPAMPGPGESGFSAPSFAPGSVSGGVPSVPNNAASSAKGRP